MAWGWQTFCCPLFLSMNTFVINLHDRPKRLESALIELGRAGVSARRWDATDARMGVVSKFHGRHFTRGALGCLTSHLSLLRAGIAFDLFPMLICEDDIRYNPCDWKAWIESAPNADVLNLGWAQKRPMPFVPLTDFWGEAPGTYGTHALYFPHAEGAERLIRGIEASEWTLQYDGMIQRLQQIGHITLYYTVTPVFSQRLEFDSDVQHPGHHEALRTLFNNAN